MPFSSRWNWQRGTAKIWKVKSTGNINVLSKNPHAVSKQIQMSPTSKSKAWASRSGSGRWYQWSAGPSWWHNIDLRSWMMIEPRYWPTYSQLHQDITPFCRSRRHQQLDRLWLIADSSLSSTLADLIMTLTYWIITITTLVLHLSLNVMKSQKRQTWRFFFDHICIIWMLQSCRSWSVLSGTKFE